MVVFSQGGWNQGIVYVKLMLYAELHPKPSPSLSVRQGLTELQQQVMNLWCSSFSLLSSYYRSMLLDSVIIYIFDNKVGKVFPYVAQKRFENIDMELVAT